MQQQSQSQPASPSESGLRHRRRSSSASPGPVRQLFTHQHPYDEFPYTCDDGATQAEHRTALLVAVAAWVRDKDSGAQQRLADLASALAYENKADIDVVQYAIDISTRVLSDMSYIPVSTIECVAAGFVTEERFVDPDVPHDEGMTVRDMWSWSPLEPLRDAPPLCSAWSAVEDVGVRRSWSSHKVTITGPLWAWLAGVAIVVAYCWLVAMLVGNGGRK